MRRPVKINHVELHRWVGLTSLEMRHGRDARISTSSEQFMEKVDLKCLFQYRLNEGGEACFTATHHQRAATGDAAMFTFG